MYDNFYFYFILRHTYIHIYSSNILCFTSILNSYCLGLNKTFEVISLLIFELKPLFKTLQLAPIVVGLSFIFLIILYNVFYEKILHFSRKIVTHSNKIISFFPFIQVKHNKFILVLSSILKISLLYILGYCLGTFFCFW